MPWPKFVAHGSRFIEMKAATQKKSPCGRTQNSFFYILQGKY